MAVGRTRLSQTESRKVALAAARDLLITNGPKAVTLKAIAARVGRTHANLLHHFGSARGLQAALAECLGEEIMHDIREAVLGARRGETDPREIVDLAFDAYSKKGAGPLSQWMMATGDIEMLAPFLRTIRDMVAELTDPAHPNLSRITLALTLMAFADHMMGKEMSDELGLPRSTAREIALDTLRAMKPPGYGKQTALS